MAAPTEILVPIRFDLEVDGKILKDTFCWDAGQQGEEGLEEFAVGLIRDERLPLSFFNVVVDSMRRQIAEFRVLEAKAKARSLQERERLELIQIDLRVGTTSIQDTFVWDIFNTSPDDPERFAENMCRDLELDERKLAHLIAHKIREEVFNKKKELFAQMQVPKSFKTKKKKSSSSVGARGAEGPQKVGHGGTRPEEDLRFFETVVTHLTEEDAQYLDEEDEKIAMEKRQEAVHKKILEMQEKSRRGKKFEKEREKQLQQQSAMGMRPGGGMGRQAGKPWGSWGTRWDASQLAQTGMQPRNPTSFAHAHPHSLQMQAMMMDPLQPSQVHAQPMPALAAAAAPSLYHQQPPHASSQVSSRAQPQGYYIHPQQAALAAQVHLSNAHAHPQYYQQMPPHPYQQFHNPGAVHEQHQQHQQQVGSAAPPMYAHPHPQVHHPHHSVSSQQLTYHAPVHNMHQQQGGVYQPHMQMQMPRQPVSAQQQQQQHLQQHDVYNTQAPFPW